MSERKGLSTLLLFLLIVCLPGLAFAQASTNGTIAGAARDTTGAVLPGVTVEAASPALIEKVRTAVTDGGGNYKIIDLRPGVYTVTFTLPGFATYKREGIELTAGFTATSNAEMKVGGLEETVTVTGASPIVDVQNSRAQNLLRSEQLDALPSGSKSVMQLAHMTLGAVPSSGNANDVGGDKGELATGIAIHGSRGDDGRVNLDGMNINNFNGAGGGRMRVYYPNMVAVQEVTIDAGGNTAESEVGGANQNLVAREGGNTLTVFGTANWTNHSLSTTSLSDEVAARNIKPYSSVKQIYDYGVGVGGPIRKDKIWFYATNRWWGSQSPGANNFFNKSTDWRYYVPDKSRPAYGDQYYRDTSGRITWQMSRKDKIAFEEHRQDGCSCWMGLSASSAPETVTDFLYRGLYLTQITWNRPATNKLLFQASANFLKQNVSFTGMSALGKNKFTFATPLPSAPDVIQVRESIGFTTPAGDVIPAGYGWNSLGPGGNAYGPDNPNNNFNERVSVSYVTGSHAFKGGVQTLQGMQNTISVPADVANKIVGRSIGYSFRGGVPQSLTESRTPSEADVRLRSIGVFGQDQWTMKRLTMNLGVRYDQFKGYAPPISIAAGPFVPARDLPKLDNIPFFKDVTPRIGASYDVFGNGKTAIKGSWGRYLLGQGAGLTVTVAPAAAIRSSATRTWNDSLFPVGDPRRGNFVPDCVLTNPVANGECGVISDALFGTLVPGTTLSDEAREGWNVRQYNYQTSLQVQHELRPGVGLSVGYFRTQWKNQTVTVNSARTPADYTSYCITAPTDARLGDFSAKRICGLFDVVPAKQGAVNNVIRLAENLGFGAPVEVYNGVDMSMTARWGRGAFASGGVSMGQQNLNSCYGNAHPEVASSTLPRTSDYCANKNPLWNGSQIKAQAAYPLPVGFQLSGTYKNLPGIAQSASVSYTNAQIAPELGRNLASCTAGLSAAACTATTSVSLLPSGAASDDGTRAAKLYDMRLSEVDLRLTKAFRFEGRRRIQAIFDIYNVLNNRPVQAINSAYILPTGGTWLNATAVLTGRLFKFGTQIDW